MFTVKATYRGEIRKFSFPECNYFPSFDQLYNQLYRVFPISHNYFLSKLLFSPDYSQPSRILIGREIHSADEYIQCISLFQGRSWHNALLRFSVFDETPHKIPSVVASDQAHSSWNPPSWGIAEQVRSHLSAFQTSSANPDAQPQQPQPAPPQISMFHIPPPPIIYSSSVSSQPPMEVDSALTDRSDEDHNSVSSLFPQHQEPQPEPDTQKPSSCCAVAHGKAEMEALLSDFKLDLDRIITTTFGSSQAASRPSIIVGPPNLATVEPPPQLTPMPSTGNPFLPVPVPPETSFSFCLYKFCTACSTIFQGPWYSCEKCSVVMCPGCHVRGLPNFCLPVQGPHVMKKETCAACPKSDATCSEQPPLPQPGYMPSSMPYMLPMPPVPQPQRLEPTWAQGGPSVTAFTDMMRPFYPYGTPTPVMPFIPPMPVQTPAHYVPEPPVPPQPVLVPPVVPPMVVMPPVQPVQNDPREAPAHPPAPAPPPVIHRDVVCDVCDQVIEGVRHKCLDCANYDLCTSCISSGYAERHNPFHEFLDLKESGRVIVHTVFTGEGEREATPVNATRAPAPDVGTQEEPVIHNATCDLCDSRIEGNRYKCLNCPDFDTCTSCFSITPEQHPHHAFVKVAKPSDYICRESPVSVLHFATCNGCRGSIYGVRYKCMHPECPDFDLCEGCEAHPIPMHPANHPFLKMRSADTVVPTVYRVGQTTLIEPQVMQRGRWCGTSEVNGARTRPHSGSFGRGYMRNPSTHSPNSCQVILPSSRSPSYSRSRSRSRSARTWATPSRSKSPTRIIIPGGMPSPPVYGGFNERDLLPAPVTIAAPPQPYPWSSCSRINRHPSPRPLPVPTGVRIGVISRSPSRSRSRSRSYSPVRRHSIRRSHSRSWSPDYRSPLPSRPESPITSYQAPYDFHPYIVPSRYRSPSPRRYSPVRIQVPDHRQRSLSPRPSTLGWPPIFDTPVPVMSTHTPVQPVVIKSGSPSTAERESPVQTETPSVSVESSRAHLKLPPLALDASGDTFRDMWPRTSQELRHLMQDTTSINDLRQTIATAFSQPLVSRGSTTTVVDTQRTQIVADSPLTGEALLNRPLGSSNPPEMKETKMAPITHSLAALLSGNQSATTESSPLATSVSSVASDKEVPAVIDVPAVSVPLLAEFLQDITVPDGQIFPPGAEFVKCWRFLNGSERDWPESTVLMFVAGESLARDESSSQSVEVGSVKAGTEVDLWTGELKAPDTPGRYVGYWRLSDGDGNLFGDVIWVDITVTELSNRSKTTLSNESLSSSSIIVMPQSAPAQSQSSVPSVHGNHDASSPMTSSPVTAPSQPPTDDAASDCGSDGSSIELVSVPSSEDEDEPAMWEDSRSHATVDRARTAMEYVLLYDDNSSSEEEEEEEEEEE